MFTIVGMNKNNGVDGMNLQVICGG
jgi:hypothetical protein